MLSLFPRLKELSKEELAEIHYNLNNWEWDYRIGPKPSGWEDMHNYKPYYIMSRSLYITPIMVEIERKISDKYCLWWYHKNILKRTSRLKFEYYWYFKSVRRKLSNGI